MAAQVDSLSVLIVDENIPVLTLLAGMLRANKMRALLARSCREALEIAAREHVPIDLILTGETLPDMTGSELVAELRTLRPAMRAMYMAAAADGDVIRVSLRNPGVSIDFSGSVLVNAIRTACKTPLVRSSRGGL